MSTSASNPPSPPPGRGWLRRTVVSIGLSSLFSDWGHETATAILPAFLATLGASAAAWLGLIEGGVADGLSSFAKLGSGFYTDQLPRRKPIAVAGYPVTVPGQWRWTRTPPAFTLAPMNILVRAAALADASDLSRLGATTFGETFGADNVPADMARYLAEAFSPERQAAEIADPASTVLLAEARAPSGRGELVGYAYLVSGPTPAAVRGPAPLEIKRLYVARAWHGRGVAQTLMDAALDAARARGAGAVWLGVWERNPRAVAFYHKCGFTRVGEHTFVLGTDAQTDWLLVRPLNSEPPSRGRAAGQKFPAADTGAIKAAVPDAQNMTSR